MNIRDLVKCCDDCKKHYHRLTGITVSLNKAYVDWYKIVFLNDCAVST